MLKVQVQTSITVATVARELLLLELSTVDEAAREGEDETILIRSFGSIDHACKQHLRWFTP